VGEGGRIEVVVPELRRGEVVEVLVRIPRASPAQSTNGERPIGLLNGRVRIKPGFDDPLEEFDPYT